MSVLSCGVVMCIVCGGGSGMHASSTITFEDVVFAGDVLLVSIDPSSFADGVVVVSSVGASTCMDGFVVVFVVCKSVEVQLVSH